MLGILYIVGVVQAFFIEFILLNKKKKILSDKILAVWMFLVGLHLFLHYLVHIDYHTKVPHILAVAAPLPFFYGPLMLYYVQSLIEKERQFKKIGLLHLLTPVSYYILLGAIFIPGSPEQLQFIYQPQQSSAPMFIEVYSQLIDLSGVIYIIWSLILLRRHRINIRSQFSYTDEINLQWLRNIIIGMGLIWTTVLISNFFGQTEGSDLVFGAVVIFVFLIGYKGIRQGLIFTDEFMEQLVPSNNEKYKSSGLTSEMAEQYLQELYQFMESEKPYLESRLTLPQLANRMNLNHNYLSQVINEKTDQKFQDFINSYRIKEFKERLRQKDSNQFTLLGNALACGFNSKSSFNAVFKKMEGMTPSEYLKEIDYKERG